MSKQLLLILSLSVTVSALALPSLKLPVDQNNIEADASNLTNAENLTNVIQVGNVTDDNLTALDNTTNSAGLYLDAVIKALQTGDNEEANTLIAGGQSALSNAPVDARKQFEIGVRVLNGGDISEAIKYFEAANQTLN
jgi:hypothetical protein